MASGILNNLAQDGQVIRKYYQKRGTANPNKDYYFIIRNTDGTEALIVEYGFLDTKSDAIRLKNNYKKYALSVVDAILDYKGIVIDTNTYIVKKGDTLYSIAKKFNTTVDKLKDMNNLFNNTLSIGQELIVDESDNIYVVKKGDTLYSIAKMYNISVNDLKNANNMVNDNISINQKLIIPDNNDFKIYVVKSGDTLYSVAKNNNISLDALKKANNKINNSLSIGEELVIPSNN